MRSCSIRLSRARARFDVVWDDPDYGTVAPLFEQQSPGTLDAANGALVSSDWKTLVVPAPRQRDVRPLAGDGWTLSLAPGWTIGPGERPGDCRLQRASRTTE
jgi:hypothetical protein